MHLLDKLGIDPIEDKVVCLAGAGGKTTLLYLLARLYAKMGKSVALCTTTHIKYPDEPDFTVCTQGLPVLSKGRVCAVGRAAAEGKFSIPSPNLLDWLYAHADRMVIEADGSRRLPVKIPNDTEPVFPSFPHRTIVVMGLSALGKPLAQVCHRMERACQKLHCTPDALLTPQRLAELILYGYPDKSFTILLNQADTPALVQEGEKIAGILAQNGICKTAVLSLKQEEALC